MLKSIYVDGQILDVLAGGGVGDREAVVSVVARNSPPSGALVGDRPTRQSARRVPIAPPERQPGGPARARLVGVAGGNRTPRLPQIPA